jgi:hypothetical protein
MLTTFPRLWPKAQDGEYLDGGVGRSPVKEKLRKAALEKAKSSGIKAKAVRIDPKQRGSMDDWSKAASQNRRRNDVKLEAVNLLIDLIRLNGSARYEEYSTEGELLIWYIKKTSNTANIKMYYRGKNMVVFEV